MIDGHVVEVLLFAHTILIRYVSPSIEPPPLPQTPPPPTPPSTDSQGAAKTSPDPLETQPNLGHPNPTRPEPTHPINPKPTKPVYITHRAGGEEVDPQVVAVVVRVGLGDVLDGVDRQRHRLSVDGREHDLPVHVHEKLIRLHALRVFRRVLLFCVCVCVRARVCSCVWVLGCLSILSKGETG